MLSVADKKRFWAKVARSGELTACWPWVAGTFSDGYGTFRAAGHSYRSSRLAFLFTGGVLTDDKPHVLHHCDNPPCCRPAHLFAGNDRDNAQDAARKGRKPRGEQHHKAKLSEHDIRDIREYAANGERLRDIATMFGVDHSNIGLIVQRKTWKHVT